MPGPSRPPFLGVCESGPAGRISSGGQQRNVFPLQPAEVPTGHTESPARAFLLSCHTGYYLLLQYIIASDTTC